MYIKMSVNDALVNENVSLDSFVSAFQKNMLQEPYKIVANKEVFDFIKRLRQMRQHRAAQLTWEMADGPFNRDRAPYYYTTSNMKGLKRLFLKSIKTKIDVIRRLQLTEEHLQQVFRFGVNGESHFVSFDEREQFLKNKDTVLTYFKEKEESYA